MPRWKIRSRLQVWTVSCAVAVLLVVVGWGYFSAREAAIRETRDRAQFVAEGASAMLDGSLLRVAGIVEGVADSLTGSNLSISLEQLRALQQGIVENNAEVFGVCVALSAEQPLPPGWTGRAPYTYRKGGGQLGFRDLSGAGNEHVTEDWFRLVEEKQAPLWTRPYWWNGVLMVTYSHPVWAGERGARRMAGVATCDLTLDWMTARLQALPTGADGYAVLMDRTGLFVAHPNRELILEKTVFDVAKERGLPYLEKIGRKMVAGEHGIEEHTGYATGRPAWIAYLPLTSTDWIFATVVSHDGLRQRLARLAREQLLLGGLGLVALATTLAFIARSITRPVEKLCATSAELAAGHLQTPVPVQNGGDEISELARSMESMRSEIVRQMHDLAASTASRERLESELRIAHDIQMSLVPGGYDPLPDYPWLDLAAALQPARQVGGDFFDFFLTPSGQLVVLVADVSDKGVGAALYMAAARSLIRSFFKTENCEAQSVLDQINQELSPNNPKSMFVTMFCGVLDAGTRTLHFSNAGHNPPLLLKADGTSEWIEDARSAPVGMFPGTRYGASARVFAGGEILVLYTDGITEAENRDGAYFGEEALEEVVRRSATQGMGCQEMADAILAAVEKFAGGAPVSDDQTLLILKIAKPAAADSGTPPPPAVWETEIPKSLDGVQEALDSLEETLQAHGATGDALYQARLALEELATNACKATPEAGKIIARVFLTKSGARLEFEEDGEPFNSFEDAPPFAPESSVAVRKIGGVGLHLLRSMAAKIDYQRRGGWNCTTLTFPVADAEGETA